MLLPSDRLPPGCALRAGLRLFDLIDDAPRVFVEATTPAHDLALIIVGLR